MPDAITSYEVNGTTYLITANEGDAREYEYESGGDDVLAFIDETRVKDLNLDPTAFPYADLLQSDEQLGRIKASLVDGDTDGDGDYDEIYTYGARSFTIWNASTGAVVWDSKNDFEQLTAQRHPDYFNATNDENNFDNRSDDKGPEPEGVTIGEVNGKTYAFIGLERVGGVAMYDITDPMNPTFANYVNTRDFSGDPEQGTSGDLAPEGLAFVPAKESPNRTALLVVTYEVSGSVAIFELGDPVASVNDLTAESIGLQVYPNPSDNKVTFRVNNMDDAQVKVFNQLGTEVFAQGFNGSFTVNKDVFGATGIYFYTVENRGVATSGKLIIVK